MNILSVLVPVALSVAAEDGLKRYEFSEPHMGTRFGVIVYAKDESVAKSGAKAAYARVVELNRIMSDYDSTSELMRLCAKAGGEPVKVSGELFTVLKRAQKVAEESEGAFDVTIRPVVHLWRVARKTARLPDPERLKKARALVGYQNVVLNEKDRTVKLLKPGMQFDLGGIAKGYAADEMLRVLARHGMKRALVSAGGDLAMSDPPPGKAGWTVSIAAVDKKKEGPRYLTLANAAVSTSGDAEQYVEIDGKRYSHIVDPRTGIGLMGRMSATVIAPDGITSDSLTKVVAILGPKAGFAVIEKYKGVCARYVKAEEKGTMVTTTKNFPKLHKGEAEPRTK